MAVYHKLLKNKAGDTIIPVTQEVYSTSEQAVGQWVDGRALYRKTVQIPKSLWVAGPTADEYEASLSSFNLPTASGRILLVDAAHSYLLRSSGTIVQTGTVSLNSPSYTFSFRGVTSANNLQAGIGSTLYSQYSDMWVTFIYTKN